MGGPFEAPHLYRPVAASPLRVMQVLEARATSRSRSSVMVHSTSPTLRPPLTMRPSAISLPVHAHGCVGDVAEDAAVQRPHGIGVALGRLHLDHGVAGLDGLQREPDEGGDGRQGKLAAHHHLPRITI